VLTGDHPALYGLFIHQPHQEFAFAATNDGGTDVVLAHACVLLFRSYFLLFRLQILLLTLERSVDCPGSDCDQVSGHGIVSVGIVKFGIILCALRERFAQPEGCEGSSAWFLSR